MRKDRMRKSSNVEDLRDPRKREAHNLAQRLQDAVDSAVVLKAKYQTMAGAGARKMERAMTYAADSAGTKGKGRYGAGRGFDNRLTVALERNRRKGRY